MYQAMFDIGWGEFLVIGVVALIAIGPKELPGVLRMVGQWIGKARRMAAEFQGQFQEALREAEMEEIKKEVDKISASAASDLRVDTFDTMAKDLENKIGDTASHQAAGEAAATGTEALPAAPPTDAGAAASEVSALPEPAHADAPPDPAPAEPAPSEPAHAEPAPLDPAPVPGKAHEGGTEPSQPGGRVA